MFRFNHFNFNVFDLERSLKFYDEALGLKPVREKVASDGSFRLVYLGDGVTDFELDFEARIDGNTFDIQVYYAKCRTRKIFITEIDVSPA